VKHQGEQMLSITTKQCCTWLKAISIEMILLEIAKLSNIFVCKKHFVHGKRYNNLGNDVYVLHFHRQTSISYVLEIIPDYFNETSAGVEE